jgi:hypothetical protein
MGGGSGRGAESYDRMNAWPSINPSFLSGLHSEYQRDRDQRDADQPEIF